MYFDIACSGAQLQAFAGRSLLIIIGKVAIVIIIIIIINIIMIIIIIIIIMITMIIIKFMIKTLMIFIIMTKGGSQFWLLYAGILIMIMTMIAIIIGKIIVLIMMILILMIIIEYWSGDRIMVKLIDKMLALFQKPHFIFTMAEEEEGRKFGWWWSPFRGAQV